jgi:Zn2+/Cd2+-exporting ATPase
MEIEVTKAGEDATLGRVKDMIIEAERTKIPLVRMIDHYAGWYTPTVLMLVFIVWFYTAQNDPQGAAKAAIAMLVIACPCPLILATPTAMVAALSAAARLGVLVKSVVDLEGARNLTAMVFDKTGTLTTGQLEVTRLSPSEGVEGAELLRVAASAEQRSRHPVARAVFEVARKAKLNLPEPSEFHEEAGKGVRAKIDGQTILVGRGNWVTGENPDDHLKGQVQEAMADPEAEGLSTLFVIRDGQLLGWLGMADNTRPQAAGAMDTLRDMGLKRLIIVTGDRESVAKRIAGQMHTEYRAEVLPHQKLEMVDELKSRGHRVAVIGDGVNDAPALKAGDISIAMGAAGSDVAIHSASIALMNNNLNRIPFLIKLSRQTSAVVKQNLVIGGGFILLFLALAAAGMIAPVVAAVLQVVSSLAVVFNSARLVRAGEDIERAEHEALEATTQGSKAGSEVDAAAAPA